MQVFLRNVVIEGVTELSKIPYITQDDATKLNDLNDTDQQNIAGQYWREHTLLSLFQRQVLISPNATAIRAGSDSLSYREFDKVTNQFARKLIETGVNSGDVVGVFCQRGIEMMISIYSIIKAGAAYLPIDVELPSQRVSIMLEQATVRLVVCGPDLTAAAGWNVISINCEENSYKDYSADSIDREVKPDDAAYVIFTSGSTGIPKGVENPHGGIVNRLLWMQDYFSLCPGEKVIQKTPYSFDVSVWELFWPLQCGAALVLADKDSHKNPYQLAEQIRNHQINIIHFVPSMLSAFIDSQPENIDSLRAVICSGEALSGNLQTKFFSQFPGIQLYNLYGPTEAAVDVSYWACTQEVRSKIPIGQPVANTKLYVVDEHNSQVPVGVVGELWIGGVQVANGYVNSQELTDAMFIKNPFDGGMVYKTGDYARWTSAGYLEYAGRKDHQVKVNGVRIELGEIDSAIASIEGVSMSCSVLFKTEQGGQKIISYYTQESGYDVLPEQVAKNIKGDLPHYMMPLKIQRLDELPVNVNGKIDYKKLPAPEFDDKSASRNNMSSDRNVDGAQRAIFEIWSGILQRSDFSLDDNFFDLGGDSILLMQVYKQICDLGGRKISSVDMFRLTTIRSLAEHMKSEKSEKISSEVKSRASQIKNAIKRRRKTVRS
jgi:amino acid adenylation domain-containing protein